MEAAQSKGRAGTSPAATDATIFPGAAEDFLEGRPGADQLPMAGQVLRNERKRTVNGHPSDRG